MDNEKTFENFYYENNIDLDMLKSFSVDELRTYGPYIITGKCGTGKTHLLHAIENKVAKQAADYKQYYTTSENFTNDYINAMRNKDSLEDFKEKYRNLDALYIDDFNYFIGKTSTQEQLLFTFNALLERNALIVVSTDSALTPEKYNKRLVSFLSYGIKIPLHNPSKEAKLLKIQELLKEYNFNICEPELRDILSKTKNMRDVEGRMKKAFYKWEQLKFVSVRD